MISSPRRRVEAGGPDFARFPRISLFRAAGTTPATVPHSHGQPGRFSALARSCSSGGSNTGSTRLNRAMNTSGNTKMRTAMTIPSFSNSPGTWPSRNPRRLLEKICPPRTTFQRAAPGRRGAVLRTHFRREDPAKGSTGPSRQRRCVLRAYVRRQDPTREPSLRNGVVLRRLRLRKLVTAEDPPRKTRPMHPEPACFVRQRRKLFRRQNPRQKSSGPHLVRFRRVVTDQHVAAQQPVQEPLRRPTLRSALVRRHAQLLGREQPSQEGNYPSPDATHSRTPFV